MREIGLDQISLRNVKPQDMQFLDKWYSMGDELGYATGFKSFREVRERIMSYPMVSMIIALADDRAVGLICYETRNLGGKKVVWVHIIIVDPAWQSRGIGTRAVARLLDFFEARGYSDVMASVSCQNKRGLRFWEGLGFIRSPAMERALDASGTSGVAIMRKNLAENQA